MNTPVAFSPSTSRKVAQFSQVAVGVYHPKWILRSSPTGSQGTRLWNVGDMSQIQRPSGSGVRGATLVVIWARQAEEAHDVLYAGTQNGYFYCWREKDGIFEEAFVIQTPDVGEITAMAFDSTNNRLCLCTRNDIVQSWAISKDVLTGKWTPTNVFSRKLPHFAPQAITFAAFDNSQDRDIIVLGFHNNGPIYTLRGRTGEIASHWSVGARMYVMFLANSIQMKVLTALDPVETPPSIGGMALSASKTPPLDPPSLDSQTRSNRGRTRLTTVAGLDVPERSALGSRARPSFAAATMGQKLATLSVGSTEWVQVVTTAEVDDVSVIFAAQMRAMDCSEEIFVWKRAQPVAEKKGNRNIGLWFFKALVVLGCLAFVYQNLAPMFKGLLANGMKRKPTWMDSGHIYLRRKTEKTNSHDLRDEKEAGGFLERLAPKKRPAAGRTKITTLRERFVYRFGERLAPKKCPAPRALLSDKHPTTSCRCSLKQAWETGHRFRRAGRVAGNPRTGRTLTLTRLNHTLPVTSKVDFWVLTAQKLQT
ncbi:hypothetical protein C8F04DRAFT_1203437 [Mycena alexandri]|uniref:Uncharacterized protein n=1 Tax=Mycena alexandri TaxID=1745969 RepID=A0AAD6WPG0_9AGAR|nr:hypothetical protein C8F04DRAFT_1203437 [Mycena alexandri]